MNGLAYDLVLRPFEASGLGRLREELLSHAAGKVLEIGVGTGLNLSHYPADAQVTGIDPDESMRKKSLDRAREVHASIQDGDAMNLPFPDASFDTVVGTLVLCTIPDPEKAVREAFRVLKPGGRLLLLEHVRKNGPVSGKILDLLTPLWTHLADGCHLNRDPSAALQAAGFVVEEYKGIWKGLGKFWVLRRPT